MNTIKKSVKGYSENSFSIWRIVFTLVIMTFHLADGSTLYEEYPMLHYHWYIGVEFFFIMSGYLMMAHANNHAEESVWDYSWKRIKRLYPEYIVALVVIVLYRWITGSGLNPIKAIIPNWLEVFMLQSMGTNRFPYLNNPAWYVSALFISSYIVYYLIRNHRSLYLQLIGPVSLLIIYSYMYREYESLQSFIYTKDLWMNTAVLRGIAGLTIGAYVFLISQKIRAYMFKNSTKIFLCVMEICGFAGVLIFAALIEEQLYDFFMVFVIALCTILASLDTILGNMCRTRLVSYLDRLTYSMYLTHFFVMIVINRLWDTSKWYWWHIPVYFCVTIVYSMLFHKIVTMASVFCVKQFIRRRNREVC